MEYKRSKSRVPKRVVRAKVAKRYPMVKQPQLVVRAPSRVNNFRPLNILTRPAILALKHRGKLLYSDSRLISPSATNSTAYVYSANGLYDPDITGAGHQPMSFDQLIAMYEHYTVQSGKITVDFVNETVGESGFVGIGLFPDSSVETGYTKLLENGMLRYSYIAKATGDSKSHCQLTIPFNIAKINGRQESIVGDDLYRGDAASNPTEQTYIHVFAYNNATVNTINVRCNVLIEFDATFTEPRKLVQS